MLNTLEISIIIKWGDLQNCWACCAVFFQHYCPVFWTMTLLTLLFFSSPLLTCFPCLDAGARSQTFTHSRIAVGVCPGMCVLGNGFWSSGHCYQRRPRLCGHFRYPTAVLFLFVVHIVPRTVSSAVAYCTHKSMYQNVLLFRRIDRWNEC